MREIRSTVLQRCSLRRGLAAVEVALAVLAIVLDLGVPTQVLLVRAAVSLAGRREGPATLGLR